MKYRIDAYYKSGAVKQGTKLLDNIDEAIKLAYIDIIRLLKQNSIWTASSRLNRGATVQRTYLLTI